MRMMKMIGKIWNLLKWNRFSILILRLILMIFYKANKILLQSLNRINQTNQLLIIYIINSKISSNNNSSSNQISNNKLTPLV